MVAILGLRIAYHLISMSRPKTLNQQHLSRNPEPEILRPKPETMLSLKRDDLHLTHELWLSPSNSLVLGLAFFCHYVRVYRDSGFGGYSDVDRKP